MIFIFLVQQNIQKGHREYRGRQPLRGTPDAARHTRGQGGLVRGLLRWRHRLQ